MQIAKLVPQKLLKLFPLFLGCMVMFIYFIFLYGVYHLESQQTMSEQIYVFNGSVSIIMLFWALYKTTVMDPGFIQRNTLDINDNGESYRKNCYTCRIARPERSHHCSKCQRCVLNMDHHCVWTSNCIGLYNRKHFNLILIWGSIGMLHATFLGAENLGPLYNKIMNEETSNFVVIRRVITFLMIISQIFNGLGLYYFMWSNLRLIMWNISTLDELLLDNREKLKKEEYENLLQYNLGWKYNFKFYFGRNPIFWLLPVGSPLGDGYKWDRRIHSEEKEIDEGIQLV